MEEQYGLDGFEPVRKEIKFKAGTKLYNFTVRGLNLEDLTMIVANRIGDLDEALNLYNQMKSDVFTRTNLDRLVVMLIQKAPGLAAEVTSAAAGQPELVATYAKLPLAVGAEALAEVVSMTIEEVGGLKNLGATLANIVTMLLPAETRASLIEMAQAVSGRSISTGASGETLVSSLN